MSRAYIDQPAAASWVDRYRNIPAAAAVVRIDGYSWRSDVPANAGEAATINREAEALVAALNRPEAAR